MIHLLPQLLLFLLGALAAVPASAGEVNLSVAASLRDVVNELSDKFGRMNRGVKFVKNYGGSGALAKQIESGAPVDIFISANEDWMEYLKHRKLVKEKSIATFTSNTLVFAGRTQNKVSTLHDLHKLEKIAIGSPKSVPAGEYAIEALKKAGIHRQLERKLVMARDVRECLMYAERGEVDGAFVYFTDALQAKQVKILFTVPQGLYPRIIYPIGMTNPGVNNREASAFYAYLQSRDARVVLGKYGFVVN